MLRFCYLLLLFSLLTSCDLKIFKDAESEIELEVQQKDKPLSSSIDPEKGKVVYFANCTSCHNYDPKKPGSIGPQIYGSSKELLTLKMNFGKYPENYQPKRSSKLMPLLPHLSQKITNLHAFLNAPAE
ncbi:MAG: cytochrome c [SAR324 cluster bacterium]|jgi:mono/diheme cytochrome c family protein|nr:cytochrome c [SAR324 cluster bacterium]MCH2265867.1 cytochrome c [SAR324 cluster bacterium]